MIPLVAVAVAVAVILSVIPIADIVRTVMTLYALSGALDLGPT